MSVWCAYSEDLLSTGPYARKHDCVKYVWAPTYKAFSVTVMHQRNMVYGQLKCADGGTDGWTYERTRNVGAGRRIDKQGETDMRIN